MSSASLPVGEALMEALRSRADRALKFYDFDGESLSLTFATFARGVTLTARRLRHLGAGPGVVVALLGPTGGDLCRTAAAVWSVGATLTVLATPTRLGNLQKFMDETADKLLHSQAGVLIGDPSMVEAFAPTLSIPVLSWEALESGTSSTGLPAVNSAANTAVSGAALIQFSSGTTRDPQPILLSDGALLANARAVLAKFPGGSEGHSCVSWLPLYHDMGLIGCFLMPLLGSANLTLMGPEVFAARPVTWLEAISRVRGTISPAPNFALAYCADRISEDASAGLDLSSWSIAMVGAEPVRPQTLRRFAQRFASVGFSPRAFSPVYGLAEATLAVTFSPLGEGLRTLSLEAETLASTGQVRAAIAATGASRGIESPSLGPPLDGVQVAIHDPAGVVVGEDRLGEVLVKGPSLFSGYLSGDPGERLTEDGWLRTGDMGFLHRGELHLYGRRRDILLLQGRNHDPSLLEGAVEMLAPLRRCCAFTRQSPHSADRDILVLVCEVSGDHSGDPERLRAEISAQARVAGGLTPAELLLVKSGSLPTTSSGKLRRGETAELHAAGALEPWLGPALRLS